MTSDAAVGGESSMWSVATRTPMSPERVVSRRQKINCYRSTKNELYNIGTNSLITVFTGGRCGTVQCPGG
jgi:hypothetical protein